MSGINLCVVAGDAPQSLDGLTKAQQDERGSGRGKDIPFCFQHALWQAAFQELVHRCKS